MRVLLIQQCCYDDYAGQCIHIDDVAISVKEYGIYIGGITMLLIKNVHLYAPEDLGVQDVLIVQGRIAHIEKNMKTVPYMDILDGSGKRMTPWID